MRQQQQPEQPPGPPRRRRKALDSPWVRGVAAFVVLSAAFLAFFARDGTLQGGDWIFAIYLAAFGCYILLRFGYFARRLPVQFAGPNPHVKRERLRSVLRRDRFPSLDEPEFLPGSEAANMEPEERVVGVEVDGEAKAYPMSLMSFHEVANDKVGGLPVAVTWSPVCYSPRAFVRRAPRLASPAASLDAITGTGLLEFGNSGKLILNSSVYYDESTQSLWLQFMGQAVDGPYEGWWLEQVPAVNTSWQSWLDAYPGTLVLDKGESAGVDLFDRYYRADRAGIHKQPAKDRRWRDKDVVLGVEVNEEVKAYPFPWLIEQPLVAGEIGGEPVCVVLERISATALALDPRVEGRTLTFERDGENPRRPEEPEGEGEEMPEIVFEPLFLRDRETGSRWRAVSGECVEGEFQGRRLRRLPTSMGFWFVWSRFYPGAEMMAVPERVRELMERPVPPRDSSGR